MTKRNAKLQTSPALTPPFWPTLFQTTLLLSPVGLPALSVRRKIIHLTTASSSIHTRRLLGIRRRRRLKSGRLRVVTAEVIPRRQRVILFLMN